MNEEPAIRTVEWFDGTHRVRLMIDPSDELGIAVSTCEADPNGVPVGPFKPFLPNEYYYWKAMARVLKEAVLHLTKGPAK